jgi:hypothetical protein
MLIVLCVVLSRQDFILNYHNADNIIDGLPRPMTGGQERFHRLHGDTTKAMKAKTRNRKSYKWRKRCDSSPIAKGRRAKIHGKRNPRKLKHLGGRGL